MKLAREIVSIYHSEAGAEHGEKEFIRVFQQGSVPEEMPVYTMQAGRACWMCCLPTSS